MSWLKKVSFPLVIEKKKNHSKNYILNNMKLKDTVKYSH